MTARVRRIAKRAKSGIHDATRTVLPAKSHATAPSDAAKLVSYSAGSSAPCPRKSAAKIAAEGSTIQLAALRISTASSGVPRAAAKRGRK